MLALRHFEHRLRRGTFSHILVLLWRNKLSGMICGSLPAVAAQFCSQSGRCKKHRYDCERIFDDDPP